MADCPICGEEMQMIGEDNQINIKTLNKHFEENGCSDPTYFPPPPVEEAPEQSGTIEIVEDEAEDATR